MIVNLSIELMFYIKDKIEKMVRSAGLEPTPQASEAYNRVCGYFFIFFRNKILEYINRFIYNEIIKTR